MLPCSPASLVRSPQGGPRRSLLSKRHRPSVHSSISCKRYKLTCQYLIEDAGFVLNCHSLSLRPSLPERSGSPEELLQSLVPQLHPPSVQVEVIGDQALSAGLNLVRRADFDPTQTLSVRSVAKSFPELCLLFRLFAICLLYCGMLFVQVQRHRSDSPSQQPLGQWHSQGVLPEAADAADTGVCSVRGPRWIQKLGAGLRGYFQSLFLCYKAIIQLYVNENFEQRHWLCMLFSSVWGPLFWCRLPAGPLSGPWWSTCWLLFACSLSVSIQLPSQPSPQCHTYDPWHTLHPPGHQGKNKTNFHGRHSG